MQNNERKLRDTESKKILTPVDIFILLTFAYQFAI